MCSVLVVNSFNYVRAYATSYLLLVKLIIKIHTSDGLPDGNFILAPIDPGHETEVPSISVRHHTAERIQNRRNRRHHIVILEHRLRDGHVRGLVTRNLAGGPVRDLLTRDLAGGLIARDPENIVVWIVIDTAIVLRNVTMAPTPRRGSMVDALQTIEYVMPTTDTRGQG
jgi:hypothetical protein